jgi:hypothetical protein
MRPKRRWSVAGLKESLFGGGNLEMSSSDSHIAKAEEFFERKVLDNLEPTRENRITVSDIATATSVHPNTAGYLLVQLSEKGLLDITPASNATVPISEEILRTEPEQVLIIKLTEEGVKVRD